MSSNRYDRQNRVYGAEATTKIQTSHVIIFGEKCDLMFEVAKNLLLSGIKKISFYNDNDNETDGSFVNSNQFFGNIHKFNYDKIIKELLILNPTCEVQMLDDQSYDNAVMVFINFDMRQLIILNTFIRHTTKAIAVYLDEKNQIHIYDDFYYHTVTDTDGESYTLSTLVSIEKTNDNYIITTQEAHNLYNNDLIKLEYTHENIDYDITTNVCERIKANQFSIQYEFKSDINFDYGQIHHLKQKIALSHKKYSDIINTNITLNKFCETNPVIQMFIGAVISSECIKAITNKYLPFDQTHTFTFNSDLICRPNDKLLNKLSELKFLIVGAGAIGCELLKNLAALNCNNIIITDPDHIEQSNLSRQFLFRNEHIGASKSNSAAKTITNYNNNMNIVAYEEKLSEENQHFSDTHFPKIDIVFNALDNQQARKYVDSQVVLYKKPLFESGTLGVNGNVQPIIPHVTESYSASKDQPTESSFAVCTIKLFPSLIQHTIHYALDQFNGIFVKTAEDIKEYISQNKEEQNTKNNLIKIHKILNNIDSTFSYIEWAYCMWMEHFNIGITHLLELYPSNKLNEDGTKFWSAGKRCPIAIDKSNHIDNFKLYMLATVQLLMETYNIKKYTTNDVDYINNLIDNYNYENIDKNKYVFQEQSNYDLEPLKNIDINPQEFEKDNDDNNHIKFIHYTSMFRALNYHIPLCSFDDTKGIAGKIIPALATTTSVVASLIVLEMLKYVINNDRKIQDYESWFVCLANNTFISGEPLPPKELSIGKYKYTEWTTSEFKYTTNDTLESFMDNMSDQFECKITGIYAGVKIVYSSFNKKNINMNLTDAIKTYNTNKFMLDSDNDLELPIITIDVDH
jgi:ubiquitin-activating enzyme E1